MPSLLFVCTANHLRSPIAAAKFKAKLLQDEYRTGWVVESAGTWTVPGSSVLPLAEKLAQHHGLSLNGHKTCLVSRAQLARFDLILVMERGQKEALLAEFPSVGHHVFMLSEVVDGAQYDIPDPARSPKDAADFITALCELIERGYEKICERVESLCLTEIIGSIPLEKTDITRQYVSWKLKKFPIRMAIVLSILTGALALELKSFIQRPLGPSLDLPPTTVTPTEIVDPLPNLLEISTPIASNPIPAPGPKPLCGGPPAINILAIGSDYRYNTYLYGLSDVIKIVRVDFITPKITLLDLPRDLYVEIPGIAEHYGITHGKLNQAFLYGNPGMGYYDGPGGGPGLLARTLDVNFGERPDHYIAMNMQVFVKVIDAVGGIDVNLPNWTLGLSPGVHHMNGTQALKFSRARPNGTFARTKQQDYVLTALWNKVHNPSFTLSHFGSMISAFQDSVETDLAPGEIQQLICLGRQLSEKDVKFLNWPNDMFIGTRINDPVLGSTFILDVNKDLFRAYIAAFNRGEWPEASTSNLDISSALYHP